MSDQIESGFDDPTPPQPAPPPATEREMFLAFEWLREMGLRATAEGKALERRCFAIMSELNKGLIIRLAAQDLMTFLGENTGTNDDWPIEIMTDSDEVAAQLAQKFDALKAALKAEA